MPKHPMRHLPRKKGPRFRGKAPIVYSIKVLGKTAPEGLRQPGPLLARGVEESRRQRI